MLGIKKFLPQSLLGRSILIVIVPVLILQVFTVYMFFDRHWSRMTDRLAFAVAGEVAVIADSVEEAPAKTRADTISNIQGLTARSLDLLMTYDEGAVLSPVTAKTTPLRQLVIDTLNEAIQAQVRRPFTVRMIEDNEKVEIKVQLHEGVLSITCLQRRLYSSSSYIFLLWMVSISMLLSVIAVMFMRNQIRPIRKLAIAAERFGKGQEAENFKPEGAREVRQAARAFIDMRDRLRRQFEQRTAMLAGVSHDLRTPMTRLKLGLSLLPDDNDVSALRDDVTTMERMIEVYLDFARGEGGEKPTATDMTRLLNALVEQERRAGANITADVQSGLYLTVRPMAIERALGNILSNARKYGHTIKMTAALDDENLRIIVDDDGPGIPPDKYDDVFRPFYRLDPSRNITGGVGLGLSIALDLVQAHGGHITLDRAGKAGGLRVIVELPR